MNVPQRSTYVAGAIAAFAGTFAPALAHDGQALPDGFVYLADVAPTIIQDLRYATAENFTSLPVPGYGSGACVLKRGAAEALARVQLDLAGRGLALKVYDCYRPARATAAFMSWAQTRRDGAPATSRYHPRTTRSGLVEAGYISSSSSHSTGMAVDLTLVPAAPRTASRVHDSGCGARPDGSLDMGSGFDCFDAASHSDASGLSQAQRDARQNLADAMRRHGFRAYVREWWHFTFAVEPPGRPRDFVVPARVRKEGDR
jgi:zinc D-Ala-D-Ala dipeptidase